MKKTLFVISDVHGFYREMMESLTNAGFDPSNENHLLITLGDCFDRGPDSLSIYSYLKNLSDKGKAIVLKGNHTLMFEQYLDGTTLSPFNYLRNGTKETFADFLGRTAPFESWCVINKKHSEATMGDFAEWLMQSVDEINKEYPELLPWLKSRPYFYETENYIFTHGAIDTIVADWHYPNCYKYDYENWEALMWDDGSFFGKSIPNTNKTVVIGHFGTDELRQKYNIVENGDPYGILKRWDNRVIAIDTTTVLSHRVNVLKIEGEEIYNEQIRKLL